MLPKPEPKTPVNGMHCSMRAGRNGLPAFSHPAVSSYFQQSLTSQLVVVLFHIKHLWFSQADHGIAAVAEAIKSVNVMNRNILILRYNYIKYFFTRII
jgi:hypothetical protein